MHKRLQPPRRRSRTRIEAVSVLMADGGVGFPAPTRPREAEPSGRHRRAGPSSHRVGAPLAVEFSFIVSATGPGSAGASDERRSKRPTAPAPRGHSPRAARRRLRGRTAGCAAQVARPEQDTKCPAIYDRGAPVQQASVDVRALRPPRGHVVGDQAASSAAVVFRNYVMQPTSQVRGSPTTGRATAS